MNRYQSYRIMTGRIRMHVMEWPGGDPPVLFLHSFTANALAALPLGNLLAGAHRLIAPDLRGRGRSDMPFSDYGPKVHLADMTACLDRLEVEHVVLAGHSFGAALAVMLAAQFSEESPERLAGLMLFDGGAPASPTATEALTAYYDHLQYRYATMDEYVDRYRHAPLYQPFTEELETLIRSNLFEQPDGTYIRRMSRFVMDSDRSAQHRKAFDQLPSLYMRLNCPTLILRAEYGITGAEDQVLDDETTEAMAEDLSAQVVTIKGVGHTSLLTSPSEERDQAILRFLSQLA
jgi:pimeloyl-ACP methyl ester carboxylesterase